MQFEMLNTLAATAAVKSVIGKLRHQFENFVAFSGLIPRDRPADKSLLVNRHLPSRFFCSSLGASSIRLCPNWL